MRSDRYEQKATEEKEKKTSKKKIWIPILVIVILIGGLAGYRMYSVKTFPGNAKIDGISVGGLTVTEASEKVTKEANQIQLKEDSSDAVTVKTKFVFDIEESLHSKLMLSSVDPRNYVSGGADYTMPLKVKSGIKETAKVIRKKIPDRKGSVKTQDAHINYDTMRIVKEVYGDSLDETALTEDVAKYRESSPKESAFTFKSDDYVRKPQVKFDDLQEELKFAKYYLADGLKLKTSAGGTFTVTPKQLSKVILYTKDGPKYSKKGAKAVAKEIGKDYSQDMYTVDTEEGSKTLVNYVIENEVDVEKTAESILSAAKSGKTGTLYLKASKQDLSTRVEVSIASQTVYYVENGKVKLKTSVVTGSDENATPYGIFQLAYKERNATLKGSNGDGSSYASKVSYWMPFNGGIGLHDAPWRSSFGGTIYHSSGSHGCVNMPPSQAKKLFSYIDAGTLVYVYN